MRLFPIVTSFILIFIFVYEKSNCQDTLKINLKYPIQSDTLFKSYKFPIFSKGNVLFEEQHKCRIDGGYDLVPIKINYQKISLVLLKGKRPYQVKDFDLDWKLLRRGGAIDQFGIWDFRRNTNNSKGELVMTDSLYFKFHLVEIIKAK